MGNLATLQTAPPFTPETAKIHGRTGGLKSAETRRAKAQAFNPSEAQRRAMAQVDKILRWMDKENDRDEYAKLTGMLDRVWNKAFPTQGAARPGRNRDRQPMAAPMPEEQPKAVDPNTNQV